MHHCPESNQDYVRLLRGAAAEQEKAVACLAQTCQEKVQTHLQVKGADATTAEELFWQSTMDFVLLVRRGKYRGEAAPLTLLKLIAERLWFKVLRNKGSKAVTLTESHEEAIAHEQDAVFTADLSETMQLCLDHISEACRKVLRYSAMNWSMEEIAETLGFKNAQNAMNKKSKCLKTLKQYLSDNQSVRAELRSYL